MRTIFIFMVANSLEIVFILSYRVGASGVRKTSKVKVWFSISTSYSLPFLATAVRPKRGFPQLSVSAVKTEECNTTRRLALVLRVRMWRHPEALNYSCLLEWLHFHWLLLKPKSSLCLRGGPH